MMLALLTVACKEEPTRPTRTVSELTCTQPGGQSTQCSLMLDQGGGFQITLTRIKTCRAHGNKIRLTQPVSADLTTDACYAPVGTVWQYAGPYSAGTAISMEIESPVLQLPAALRVSGMYPTWTLEFEEGRDEDGDDVTLEVKALP